MHLDTALRLAVLAVLAAPALAQAAPPSEAAAAATERTDRGVRFAFPAGFQVTETTEKEPGEEHDIVFVATKGALELRVEVEKGDFKCSTQALAGAPRAAAGSRPTCELELPAPPSLDPKASPRRAASVLVQFPGRFLSVVAFAPKAAESLSLARQVAATAGEAK